MGQASDTNTIMKYSRLSLPPRPSLAFVLLCLLLATLWLAGGASRADALGQVFVRTAAWSLLIVAILFGERFRPAKGGPVLVFLIAAVVLALLQLIPLPPMVWQALPGRAMLAEAAAASGQQQPWRPWAIVPSSTLNALSSLVIPVVTLILVTGLSARERTWLPGMVLGLIAASTFVGLLQFAGGRIDNPLINDSAGEVSGTFANRNHLALFVAMGCLLAPTWVFLRGRHRRWRLPIASGLMILFLLIIMANGSRAGLVLAVLALALGIILTQRDIRKELRRAPKWAFPVLLVTIAGMIGIFVFIAVSADRAVSVSRALVANPAEDLRREGLPTLMVILKTYFPFGAGLGSFDPIFRIHEPAELLRPTYFNHAHNDWLEIVLDAGVPGLIFLLCGITWWAISTFRAWRADRSELALQARLGSAMLLLIMLASVVDYPARTPMIMAIMVVAGIWLGDRVDDRPGSALPKSDHPL